LGGVIKYEAIVRHLRQIIQKLQVVARTQAYPLRRQALLMVTSCI
jgi:ATP/maltotriose-dependent transcriptional regulator MalT